MPRSVSHNILPWKEREAAALWPHRDWEFLSLCILQQVEEEEMRRNSVYVLMMAEQSAEGAGS